MKLIKPSCYSEYDHQHHYRQLIILSVLIPFVSLLFISCGGSSNGNDTLHANTIAEVKIGNQVWMSDNFNGATFNNGDSIPHAKSAEEWERAGREGKPAWCYYKNDAGMGGKYGRIYNWYAINDARGFSPKGWHVPTNDEWIALEEFVGTAEAGVRLKCSGDTTSGFCALLGGYRSKEGGFSGVDEFTYMASATERDQQANDAWGRGIHNTNNSIMRCGLYKAHGMYVRLIKD
jgi:uncharacterized protein (TIGR02145 family)